MKKNIIRAAVIVFFFGMGGALPAQDFPPLTAAPEARELARRFSGGVPRWIDTAEASLWASSVNLSGAEERTALGMEKLRAAVTELSAAELPRDLKERGEYVLSFLHKRFLRAYSENQTRVDEVFVSGRYNCVSSAVLYMTLCMSVGVEVEGVMTKDHAFIRVNTGAEYIDVETTNPYGFDPGNRKEFHDAFGKATGFAYVPAKNYRDRTTLTPAELVSLILSNRIALAERANRFAEAVPLAINRAAFLEGTAHVSARMPEDAADQNTAQHKSAFFEDPNKDMMTRLFNLGAYYVRSGKEDDAIAWAEYAGLRYPDLARWRELIKAAANNKLVKLIRAKRTEAARTALGALHPVLGGEDYRAFDMMVLEAEAADTVNGIRNPGDVEAALAFLADEWDRLPPQSRGELRTVALLAEANRYGKARDWTGGMRWLNDALAAYGADAKIETALRTFRQNRDGELHNEFAALYNKKDYEGAKAAAQKALTEFPGERQLINNLNFAERMLARQ